MTKHPPTPAAVSSGADLHAPNPVHDDPEAIPDARWDRRNTGEGAPEVSSPMTASWSRRTGSAAQLRMMHLLGAVTASELGGRDGSASPMYPRLTAYFCGRRCLDATATLGLLGRLPRVDAGSLSEQVFGERLAIDVEPLTPSRKIAAVGRLVAAAAGLPRRIERRSATTATWWATSVSDAGHASWSRARALLDRAEERMRDDLAVHAATTVFQTGFAEAVNGIAIRHLDDGELLRLHGGLDEMSETTMLAALREASRAGTLDAFQRSYGFYAPDAGELMTRSWREDLSGLSQVLAGYDGGTDPTARHLESRRAFEAVQRRLLGAASPSERAALKVLLGRLRRFTTTRERSKAMMLQCTDAARAAVRRLGWHLEEMGRIDEPEDVFFLTMEELDDAPRRDDLRPWVTQRKELGRRYAEVSLPFSFTGSEVPQIIEDSVRSTAGAAAGAVLEGLGVSAGEATGRVVVMLEPSATFEVGDVLVCPTTDPGWSALLSIASAVVMDMGSTLSHGAIVARELGIPCVANVEQASRRLRTGQVVRVDGGRGVVEVVADSG
ncbi:MAG TPA: PEP-utilizing enzyme [Acidimicrobiales bacterium]